jgi:Uma2 family endonuclease
MATATEPGRVGNVGGVAPLPEGPYEVIGDQIVEKPPMGVYECGLAGLLFELLGPFARAKRLGQVFSEPLFDLRPTLDRSRRPDLAFVSARKWPVNRRPPRREAWPLVPDLAVEVVSPSNEANEVIDKVGDYLQAGVQVVWVIYPSAREIHVFDARTPTTVGRVLAGQVLRGDPLFPEFELPLDVLFGESDEDEATPTAGSA